MKNQEYRRLFSERDPDYGGVGCLITGLPGCGKTNVMASIALGELQRGNVVVWRAKDTCQWTVLLNKTKRVVFWLHKSLEYKLVDRNQGKEINLEDIMEIRRWSTPRDLVGRLSKRKINIIQTVPVNPDWSAQHGKFISQWIGIMQWLAKRYYATPVSLFIDEIEDLAPEGKFYQKASQVSDMTKELRKNHINYFGATHKTTEIFWKLLNKIPWHMYMSGAIPIRGSKVFPSVIKKLKQGQAILEGQRYERVDFKFVGKEKNYRAIIKLSKVERDRIKEQEQKSDFKRNQEFYIMIYKDVLQNNLSQTEAAKKYKLTQPRISQIIKDVGKILS